MEPEPQIFDLRLAEDSRREYARQLQHDAQLRAASGQGTSLREPLELQVLRQLPPQACGYRLLIRLNNIVRTFDTVPGHRSWRVTPFEPPNDDRLVPDTHYRIVWFDAQDRELPALPNTPLPCLYLFLGPPDADAAARSHEVLRHLQVAAELKQRVQKLEAELATTKEELQISQRKVRGLRKRMVRRVRALRRKHKQEVDQKADNKLLKLLGAVVAGGYGLAQLRSVMQGHSSERPSANSDNSETARTSPQPAAPQAASKPAQPQAASKPSEPQLSPTVPQALAPPKPAPLPAKWRQAQDVLQDIASLRQGRPVWPVGPAPAKPESPQTPSLPDLERELAPAPAGRDAAATPSSRWGLGHDRAALEIDEEGSDEEGDEVGGYEGELNDPREVQKLAMLLDSLDDSELATRQDPESLRQYLSAKLDESNERMSGASESDNELRAFPPAGTDPSGSSFR